MSVSSQRWRVLIVGCVINLFAGSIYAWSVFAEPLAHHLSLLSGSTVRAADLFLAFSLANAIGPVPMILGGWVSDRFGPRQVVVLGGILIGLGYWLAGSAESVTALTLCYGLFYGLGLGFTYGTVLSTVMKHFPDRRGLAGGLATAAYGISSVVLAPLASAVIEAFGITAGLHAFGAAFALVIGGGGLFLQKCPEALLRSAKPAAGTGIRMAADRDWREMLRSREFLPMLGMLLCGATAGMMIISQAYSIGAREMLLAPAAASAAVSLLALANTFGRILAGTASDYLGRPRALAAGLAAAAAGLGVLALADPENLVCFYAALICIGLAFGTFMGVFPGFTAQVFGPRHNGVNFGIMFCGFAAAGILGPFLMKAITGAGFGLGTVCAAGACMSLLGFVFLRAFQAASRRKVDGRASDGD